MDSLSLLLTSNDVRLSTDIAKATGASPELLTRIVSQAEEPWRHLTSVGVWRMNYSSLALSLVILGSNGRQNGSKASLSRPQPSPTFPPQCRTSEDGKTDNLFSVSTRTMECSAVTKSPWQPAGFLTSNLSTLARHSVVHLSAVCCWIWGLEGLLRSLEMPGKLTMLADERRMNGSTKSC